MDDYIAARHRWRIGLPTVLPAGTYWPRHFAFMRVAGPAKIRGPATFN